MNKAEKSTPVQILLVGIGGYGNAYIEALDGLDNVTLAAIVDPAPEKAPNWLKLKSVNIPAYASIDDFLSSGSHIDLAVIASPISFHADHSCALLKAGIHVLCEKPIAATMEEARRMTQARDASGCFLEIGYQWCYSDAIQSLKQDIMSGAFGTAQCLLTRVGWPRSSAYYNRNDWAGCIQNRQGQIVNDSPVGNATAHYLNNMLYILGQEINESTRATAITAECYRANPIENYDTACCRIETAAGANIYFYSTHAIQSQDGPIFKYCFEKAEIYYEDGGDIIATLQDGSQKNYGDPDANRMLKLRYCIDQCLNSLHRKSICSTESASALTECVEALQKIRVRTIPQKYIAQETLNADEILTYVPGVETAIKTAFDRQQLFSDLNIPWAAESTHISI